MTIHKEGFKTILIALLLTLIINVFVFYLVQNSIIQNVVLGITSVIFLLVVNFFRSPTRICSKKENTIITPADGEVVVIEEVFEPEYLKQNCIQVSVFMSPLNVHVNWFPISGVVKFAKHHSGKFMRAYLPKSSTENERTTVVVETKEGKNVLVRQVAGAVARRIVCYAKEGMNAEQGEQMGFIKFGSRLDLYLPLGSDIKVKIGDKVVGTQTAIAEI